MSRQIDPDNLSDEDREYIAQRPHLREEFVLQGYDDPLADYESPNDPRNIHLTNSPNPRPDTNDGDNEDGGTVQASENDYENWKKAELQTEIARRNEDRDEEDEIVPEKDTVKAMAKALAEDDAENEDGE